MAQGSVATITVTGKIGPGNTLTSNVFNNISIYSFDVVAAKLTMVGPNNQTIFVDISTDATITVTLTANGNHTVTVAA